MPEAFGPRKPLFGPYSYRVKQNYNGDTLLAVYVGSKRIAHMDAYWLYSMRTVEDREEEVQKYGRGRACATDLRALGAEGKYPNVLGVSHAFITDDAHKGKGVGRAMYEAMMAEGFAVRESRTGGKPGPMFFIPDECKGVGNTSAEARRVWASLVRDYPSAGTSIRVDAPPVIGSRAPRANPMTFDVRYSQAAADANRGSRVARSILSETLREKSTARMANSPHNFLVILKDEHEYENVAGTPGAVTLVVSLNFAASEDIPATQKSQRESIYTAFTYLHRMGDMLYGRIFDGYDFSPFGARNPDPVYQPLYDMLEEHVRILEKALGSRAGAAADFYLDAIATSVNSQMVREGYSLDASQAFADLFPLAELTPPSRPLLLSTPQRPVNDRKRLPQAAYDVFNDVLAPDFNVRFRAFYADLIRSLYGKVMWI
jgi:hypothetical protein